MACTPAPVQSQEGAMLSYAATHNITPSRHSSGMYYQIVNDGTGSAPGASSRVFVRYKGKLTDGRVFDEQQDHSKTGWALNTLIQGWQLGIPLIKKGGSIRLIIPAALAYGCEDVKDNTGQTVLPGNSILAFDIDLVDFQ